MVITCVSEKMDALHQKKLAALEKSQLRICGGRCTACFQKGGDVTKTFCGARGVVAKSQSLGNCTVCGNPYTGMFKKSTAPAKLDQEAQQTAAADDATRAPSFVTDLPEAESSFGADEEDPNAVFAMNDLHPSPSIMTTHENDRVAAFYSMDEDAMVPASSPSIVTLHENDRTSATYNVVEKDNVDNKFDAKVETKVDTKVDNKAESKSEAKNQNAVNTTLTTGGASSNVHTGSNNIVINFGGPPPSGYYNNASSPAVASSSSSKQLPPTTYTFSTNTPDVSNPSNPSAVSFDRLDTLRSMGFTNPQECMMALENNNGDVEAAAESLRSGAIVAV